MRVAPFLRSCVLATTLLCTVAPAIGKPADRIEKAIVSDVKSRQEPAVKLLEQVVNINSGTMNLAGVRAVADVFRPQFEALGFNTRWVDGAEFGRAGHLVAERAGKGRHVLLIGHLDTVFEPDHPFQHATRVDANTLRGPGTADMKGGIVVALTALQALQKVGALDDLHITVVLHGDEEDSGAPLAAARATLIAAAEAADIAIGLENAADDPATAVTARRSSGRWQIKVTGKTAHSSQIFTEEYGAGAIYELARILNGFYTELQGEELLTFNPGLVAGSTQLEYVPEPLQAKVSGKDNIIAPVAVASGDLRAITPQQITRTQEKMRQIVAAHLPQTSAEIAFDEGYPPMAPTDGNARLLKLYDQVSRDLGFGAVTAVNPRRAGAADVSFAASHVEMAIDGLGLLGGGSHTADEFADLRTLQIQAQRLAVLLYRLGKG
ncbi:MAG TPA: M20/M25/M40 family metallo-hydrolase [Povalibacter sp.]|nr:M20/M25/M40 family metallo-hydrolase [Povalibacter sp.]